MRIKIEIVIGIIVKFGTMAIHKKPNKSNLKLFRIVGITGVVVSSGCLLMQWFMNRRLRQAEYYRRGTETFMKYPPIVSLFGEPVYFGNPDLGDKDNFSTEEWAQFKIPIQGQKNRGFLYVKANANPQDTNNPTLTSSPNDNRDNESKLSLKNYWSINQVEVTIDNRPGEKVILPLESSNNHSPQSPE